MTFRRSEKNRGSRGVLLKLKRSLLSLTILFIRYFCFCFWKRVRLVCDVFYKWVELPSGRVVPGSCVLINFGCCLVNFCGGLFRCTILAQWFTWEGAPCQVGTRLVKLASLSSKSTCNICCIWSSGCSFGFCIPVSSLQYQLIGKLLGSGTHPHRWARQNWSENHNNGF